MFISTVCLYNSAPLCTIHLRRECPSPIIVGIQCNLPYNNMLTVKHVISIHYWVSRLQPTYIVRWHYCCCYLACFRWLIIGSISVITLRITMNLAVLLICSNVTFTLNGITYSSGIHYITRFLSLLVFSRRRITGYFLWPLTTHFHVLYK